MNGKIKVVLILLLGMNLASNKHIIRLTQILTKSRQNKVIAAILSILAVVIYRRMVTYKPTIIKYLLKFMELMMPEEFRPEIQQKSQKASQQGGDQEDFKHLLSMQMRRESSCRQRTLSVIKEEVEGADE